FKHSINRQLLENYDEANRAITWKSCRLPVTYTLACSQQVVREVQSNFYLTP
ncbi:unnamed protein product, partial [Larinioides sclopetarius]